MVCPRLGGNGSSSTKMLRTIRSPSIKRVLRLSTTSQGSLLPHIPYVAGLPFLGTALDIGAAGGAPKLHAYIDARHNALGPIFQENMGNVRAVFISDPALIRQVFSVEGKYPKHFIPKAWALYNEIHGCKRGLFFMEDEEWYQYRRLMNKHFLSPAAVQNLRSLHEKIVSRLVSNWRQYDGKSVVDMEYEFYKHSISFVLGSLIGDSYWQKIESYSAYVDELARKFQLVFDTSSKLNVLPSVKLVQFLRLPIWKKFETAVRSSLEASREMVSKALGDLCENGLLYKMVHDRIPDDIIYALVADLLIAAGDTTAFTSQWAVYLLGLDSQVQQAVREDMSLVKGVVRETLRLYPSACFIARVLPNAGKIGPYTIDSGELILVSLYTAGRDERWYPAAGRFSPQRWIKEKGKFKGVNDVNSFLPFALGARSCIGARLANAQLNMTISEILQNFELETQEKVDMVLRLVPVPSKPVQIKIKNLTGQHD